MIEALPILAGAGLAVFLCLTAGVAALRAAGAGLRREEEYPLAFVTGAALVSLFVFGVCALRLLDRGIFLGAAAAAAVLIWQRGLWRPLPDRFPSLPPVWKWIFAAVYAVFALLYLCYAMAPEMSPDGSTYHLGLVARYWREQGFQRITNYMYANLSQGVEMLFVIAFGFGRHSAAAVVHFAFLSLLPFSMLAYARRFGFPKAGLAAALLVYATPVVGHDGSVAYNDVATGSIIFSMFHLLEIWGETRNWRLLPLIGLLAGFGYAAKYTAGLAVPFAVAYVAWSLIRRKQPWLRAAVAVGLCALAVMAPWMIKNWLWLDNPFSPFFNSLFPNPYVHISFERNYSAGMREYGDVRDPARIPLELTVRGAALAGLLGPVYLLAPLGLAAVRHPRGRMLVPAALLFAATYPANIGTRFLIPALPFVALAMMLALTRWPAVAGGLALVHAALSWPAAIPLYAHPHCSRIDGLRWKAALRLIPEEEYLREKYFEYAAARLVEEKVARGGRVLTASGFPNAYTSREKLIIWESAGNEVLFDVLSAGLTPDAQPTRHIRFAFPERRLRKIRVAQTAEGPAEHWSVSEFRIFHAGRELGRAASWRLRAQPKPWDVQRAFDNSPVTRWRSWQNLYDGMFVEVDFGAAQAADSVLLETPADHWNTRLQLEGLAEGGRWEVISREPAETHVPAPPGMRRMAALELKRAGVRYLLIHKDEFGSDDFRRRPRAWGIRWLGEAADRRLYRIE